MPGRFRRRIAGSSPQVPPRPPAGLVEEIGRPSPEPALAEPVVVEPPPVLTVAGEFRSASAALVFAGGLADPEHAEYGRCDSAGTWWVATSLTLAVARELVAVAGGRAHIEVGGKLLRDRGWGDGPPTATTPSDQPEVVVVDLLDLVRSAGLHPHTLPIGEQITVLAPARRVTGIVERALDLELTIDARLLRLEPLFGSGDADQTSMFEVRLTSPSGSLPAALLAALDRDACVLVCRRISDRLLMQHDKASPLPDSQLAALAGREAGPTEWLLADLGFGSASLTPQSDFRDGAAFVRLSDRHQLPELDAGWATLARVTDTPELAPLRLVLARTPDAVVDAILLDDEDLACLPALLAGRGLADLAVLATGRTRHLMLAPGGILERLPVGLPLYRLGPGPLFLPLGTRMQPHLPPTARRALFPTTSDTALVLQQDSIEAFPLANQEPVWTLWAGPLPTIDIQLPRDARRALADADTQTTPAAAPNRSTVGRLGDRLAERVRGSSPERATSWQDEALAAELADDLVRAAELCERNGELRRAAYLYERAARRPLSAR